MNHQAPVTPNPRATQFSLDHAGPSLFGFPAILCLCSFVLASASSFASVSHSPVGDWEMTTGNTDPGVMFITFNSDFTMSGYGMTLSTFGLFTITGSWTLDAKGNTSGYFTENLGGKSSQGSFLGKATGRKIVGKVTGTGLERTVTVSGIPATTQPDISGDWVAYVTQDKVTVPEYVAFTPSTNFPGVFDFTGYGSEPSGTFTLTGEVLESSKGRVVVYGESDFASSSGTGSINWRTQTGSLAGRSNYGAKFRAKLVR